MAMPTPAALMQSPDSAPLCRLQHTVQQESSICSIRRLLIYSAWVQGTTCNQRIERINDTKFARILRVPFKDAQGKTVRKWMSRYAHLAGLCHGPFAGLLCSPACSTHLAARTHARTRRHQWGPQSAFLTLAFSCQLSPRRPCSWHAGNKLQFLQG